MVMLNRFPDADDEISYVQAEREAKVPAGKALLIIVAVISIGLYGFTPDFVSAQDRIIFNIVKLVMLGAMALTYWLLSSRHYVEKTWFDLVGLSFAAFSAVILFDALGRTTGAGAFAFQDLLTTYFVGFLFGGALFCIANVKIYLIWAIGLSAAYAGYLFTSDIAPYKAARLTADAVMFLVIAGFMNWEIDRRARQVFQGRQLLEAEREKTETLLYNVLPEEVALRLRAGEVIADSFSDITVIFIDIVGFSKLAKQLSPGHLVKQLNGFFLVADICAERHGVEKVKTIGDAYMAVSGGTASKGHGANDAVNFAKDVITEMIAKAKESGIHIKLRAGIHSGPVVGGVVGQNRLAYDYWGDTMNIASRIEGTAISNGIAISAATFFQCGHKSEFSGPEVMTLKGVGDTEIYRLQIEEV